MSNTRYGHTNRSGGNQDQGERKDAGWESRQGGRQSNEPGPRGEPEPRDMPGQDRESLPPPGTNTQGGLAGIGEASSDTRQELEQMWRRGFPSGDEEERLGTEADEGAESGTDQPRRMGGPLGPDPRHPHLPEGVQTGDTQGSGAGGFDRGVNAKRIGEVHQGVRPEEHDEA